MRTFIAAALLMASSAHAEFYTGNEIHNYMSSSKSHERSLALGFVAGVHDVYSDISICAPGNATLGQLHDVVKQYLEATPQRRHLTAQELIRDVLSAAYPCARGGRSS
jgi:hypothetical protein